MWKGGGCPEEMDMASGSNGSSAASGYASGQDHELYAGLISRY